MSKGLGRVERTIKAAMDLEADNAFTVEDLCDRVYPGVNRVEKKHRVAVIRAMLSLANKCSEVRLARAETQGGTLVLSHRYDVTSYGMSRLKSLSYGPLPYRPTPRVARAWQHANEMSRLPPHEQERRLRADLLPGGNHFKYVEPGRGAWWEHVRYEIAVRDGDDAWAAGYRRRWCDE